MSLYSGLSADALVEHISQSLRINIPLRRPINYLYYATVTLSVLCLLALFKLVAGHVLAVVRNRKVWSSVTIVRIRCCYRY